MESRGIRNDDNLVLLTGVLLNFEGHWNAADAGSNNYNFSHGVLL
jgi:hypothetical protein